MSANPACWGSAAPSSRRSHGSIDELDVAIRTLAREMTTATYRMLMLVREFDDRCGWQKWGFRSCAEWLAWRCDLTLSTAREKVRTAQALREMPTISAAFEDGRLSYSKARALTRVAEYHDAEALLDYALRVTAPQLEERCREIRNAAPESIGTAWRAWEHRSLVISRDPARGTLRISVEVPIEDGEVIAKAIERVADAGDAATGLEFAAARKTAGVRESAETLRRTVGARSRPMRCSRSRRRRWPGAFRVARRKRPTRHTRKRHRPRLRITIRSSCTSTLQPSAEGSVARICRSTPSSASHATAASSRSSRTSAARRSTSAASSARCRRR